MFHKVVSMGLSLLVNTCTLQGCLIYQCARLPVFKHFTTFPAVCYEINSSVATKGIPVPGAYEYIQRAELLLSAGPNLICVSETEPRSEASQAAPLVCSENQAHWLFHWYSRQH